MLQDIKPNKQEKQCTYYVILGGLRVTNVAVEKQ